MSFRLLFLDHLPRKEITPFGSLTPYCDVFENHEKLDSDRVSRTTLGN